MSETRKTILLALAGSLLVVGLMAGCGDDSGTDCAAPNTKCGSTCTNTNFDPSNCGTCGTTCGTGQTCNNGTCTCPGTQTDCSGTCTDTSNDPNNCGACGTACASGEVCKAGSCEGSCGTGLTDCSGSCVDLQSDEDNCGACGTTCDESKGFVCTAGACVCTGGETDCSGTCVNTANDPKNCGACGTDCGSSPCNNGTCEACPAGLTDCSGSCVDTNSSNANCGGCGQTCDTTAGFTCVSGSCACIGTTTECSGKCVDTQNDKNNCGACGTVCASGESCVGGTCQGGGCPTGLTDCNGVCKDLQVDNTNCGNCGVTCTGGKTCQAGTCTCPTNLPTDCSGTCVDTNADKNNCGACGTVCTTGQSCLNGTCTLDCGTLTNCNGVCTDLQTSNTNCGTCGVACTGGKTCSGGSCSCPSTLPNDCSGTCVNLQSDNKNCGVCGTACAANEQCVSGTCTVSPLVSVQVSCPNNTVPSGNKQQCTLTGILQNGATIPLTADQYTTWSEANNGVCGGDAGTVSNGPPASTDPKGTYTAGTAGCKGDVWATYAPPGSTFTSNKFTITNTQEVLQSVAILPGTPSVPYLVKAGTTACTGTLSINFKMEATYNSGRKEINPATGTYTWSSSDPAVAGINTTSGVSTLSPVVTWPTTNRTTTIKIDYVVNSQTFSATTVLTVVPGNLTGLTIAPSEPQTIALGNTVGFTATATFNNNFNWNVTDIGTASSYYFGWRGPVGAGNAALYINDSGGHLSGPVFTNDKWTFTGTVVHATGAAPDEVMGRFCDAKAGTSTQVDSNKTLVTVSGKVMSKCFVRTVATVPATGSPDPTTFLLEGTSWPKGLEDQQAYALAKYSDLSYGLITDKVVWSSSAPGTVLVDNSAGNEGEMDMLALGQATISANPGVTGVTPCTGKVSVVYGYVCGVTVTPNPLRFTSVGTTVMLPNESGWSQTFKATGTYSKNGTGSDCATPGGTFQVDVTGDVTWTVTTLASKPAALSYSGSNGVFTVVPDAAAGNESRTAVVKAEILQQDGQTTKVSNTYNVVVCGHKVLGTGQFKVYNAISAGNPSGWTTVAQTRPAGVPTNYYAGQVYSDPNFNCGGAASYILNVSEDASWAPDDPTIASVSNTAGEKGTVKGIDPGKTTNIGATFSGATAKLAFSVSGAIVSKCTITPATASATVDRQTGDPLVTHTVDFKAEAEFTDGTKADITSKVNWSSSNSGACTGAFLGAGGYTGCETHAGPGCGGCACETCVCAIDPYCCTNNWDGICVSECQNQCGGCIGATNRFQADCTNGVCGTSGCTSTVSAVCPSVTCSAGAAVTCTPSVPIAVNSAAETTWFIQTRDKTCLDAPATAPTINTGTALKLYGCRRFADGHADAFEFETSVTALTWASSTSAATVNATGTVTGVGAGSTSITMSYSGTAVATLVVNVTTNAITSVTIEGANMGAPGCAVIDPALEGCELEGTRVMYRAIGHRADGSTQDLTDQTTWSRSGCTSQVAIVNNPLGIFDIIHAFLSPSCTSTITATTPKGTGTAQIRVITTDPSTLTLTATPATLAGAGKIAKIKAMAAVPVSVNNTVMLDLTRSVTFNQDNPGAAYLYKATDWPWNYQLNGYLLSGPVAASQSVKLSGSFTTGTANGVTAGGTMTVTP